MYTFRFSLYVSSDLPSFNPSTLNEMILYYRLMTKLSGLGDSTELSRMGLSQLASEHPYAPE
jgi:GTP:adenosylcobinamide-phosphate guanylyltransferase